jgi:hypothetical protein
MHFLQLMTQTQPPTQTAADARAHVSACVCALRRAHDVHSVYS